jgi:ketosteroid isomerase-like protein
MDVAKKLVELCNQMKNLDAVNTLYSDKIVSIEPHAMPDMPARMEGKDAIIKKNNWFFNTHTIHSSKAAPPMVNGDKFIVQFKLDATAKEGPMAGKRMQMEECGLYTVKDGKIVQEEFFYNMG